MYVVGHMAKSVPNIAILALRPTGTPNFHFRTFLYGFYCSSSNTSAVTPQDIITLH
jgi:hypothetical protein